MARLKRLTRRQKILLSKIATGGQPSSTTPPADMKALEDHRLIELVQGGWQAIPQPGEAQAHLEELKRKHS